MLKFNANVYAKPTGTQLGAEVTLRETSFPTLTDEAGGPPRFLATLPNTFEAIQQSLLETTHCDCEPDGFFLVTGHEGEAFWRLNGHMHEYQPEGEPEPLMYRIELNGECPEKVFDLVLTAMGWPKQTLVFELVHEGVSLEEAALRTYAASSVS